MISIRGGFKLGFIATLQNTLHVHPNRTFIKTYFIAPYTSSKLYFSFISSGKSARGTILIGWIVMEAFSIAT